LREQKRLLCEALFFPQAFLREQKRLLCEALFFPQAFLREQKRLLSSIFSYSMLKTFLA